MWQLAGRACQWDLGLSDIIQRYVSSVSGVLRMCMLILMFAQNLEIPLASLCDFIWVSTLYLP